jgi:hypothetical protein
MKRRTFLNTVALTAVTLKAAADNLLRFPLTSALALAR